MAGSTEEAWAPEPELRDPPPRRVRPSEYPDLNTPNVKLYSLIGGVILAVGLVLLGIGMTWSAPVFFSIVGGIGVFAGAIALWYPANRAASLRSRAERLVREGMPLMARIVSSQNLTGDSVHGRVVSYMMTLPGGEVIRRDINADERALPRSIPANVTALIDPKNTNDAEIYCALPFRAITKAKPAEVVPPPVAPVPPTMQTITMPEPEPEPQPAAEEPKPEEQKSPSGYQGLPWE